MKRFKLELIRVSILVTLFAGAWVITPVGCQNYSPEQIAATTAGITSVVTTTGAVVTPLIINLENGQSVKAKKVKVVTAKPTPTPTP